jgi:hypothetical protein
MDFFPAVICRKGEKYDGGEGGDEEGEVEEETEEERRAAGTQPLQL